MIATIWLALYYLLVPFRIGTLTMVYHFEIFTSRNFHLPEMANHVFIVVISMFLFRVVFSLLALHSSYIHRHWCESVCDCVFMRGELAISITAGYLIVNNISGFWRNLVCLSSKAQFSNRRSRGFAWNRCHLVSCFWIGIRQKFDADVALVFCVYIDDYVT